MAMNQDSQVIGDARSAAIKARNRRTGFILATIALVFFVGIIVRYSLVR